MSDASWVPVDSYGWVFDLMVALPLVVAFVLACLLVRSSIRHGDAQRVAADARRDREWDERRRERLFRRQLHEELADLRREGVLDRL